MAANEQPERLQITRIRWAKSRYVRNLRNKKAMLQTAIECLIIVVKILFRFWNLENKNLEEQRS